MRWTRRGVAGDELEFVFVMTYGRSGSTLLMGLLNSIPGYLIRGENRHALRHLYEFHRSGLVERARVNPQNARESTHPWFGIHGFDEEASLRDIRRLVLETLLRPQRRTRVAGFKEIRWYDTDLANYVDFLRQVFPGARFVVNTRNLPDVAASAFWRHKDDALGRLEVIEERMLAVADDLGEAAYRVHYDDYQDDPGALRGLFEWLGEAFDEESIRKTLAVRHSVKARS
ncbi:sulfotransferase [Nocardioides houyundeii]|uniref:sulfotransferase n=1 Tax=Nocardioides houyundeii TaxID=2045452 RepID=UPI000DF1FD91|nr:sulfotransferase [Nocardioides houyundeii]